MAEMKKKVKNVLGGDCSSSDRSNSGSSDSKDVVELTDADFDKLVLNSEDILLMDLYAPWCGYCKNLTPHWAKAASELKGKVKLGALDSTVYTIKSQQYCYRSHSSPAITFFPGGVKDHDAAQDYDGECTSSDIVNWAPRDRPIDFGRGHKKAFQEKPLCVILVLPHFLDCDAACRNKFLVMLAKMGEKYKMKLWGWLWTERGAQPEIEATLDIGGFGCPAMVVVNVKK